MSIPGYEFIQPFSVSSSGTLWHARRADGLQCLVRFITGAQAQDLSERLQLLQGLENARVARLLDIIEDNNRVAIVTSFVEGQPLNQWMQLPGSNAEKRALSVLKDVAEGLQVLHEAGLAHGDLSATNVVVGANGAVLVDHVLGVGHTPGYVAPESENGMGQDPRPADVWAWGVLAREMGIDSNAVRQAMDPDPLKRISVAQVLADPSLADVQGGGQVPFESDLAQLNAGALLRLESATAQTVPSQQVKSRRTRGRKVVASVLVVFGLTSIGYWWTASLLPFTGGNDAVQSQVTDVKCPSSAQAESVVLDLTSKRNEAISSSDRELLATVVAQDSEVFEKDLQLIDTIAKENIEIRGLTTTVTEVRVLECSPLIIEATFAQNEHERCVFDECEVVSAQPANRVKLTFEGPPWRVVEVESSTPAKL